MPAAAVVASMIHFGTCGIPQIKEYLAGRGLAVRKVGCA